MKISDYTLYLSPLSIIGGVDIKNEIANQLEQEPETFSSVHSFETNEEFLKIYNEEYVNMGKTAYSLEEIIDSIDSLPIDDFMNTVTYIDDSLAFIDKCDSDTLEYTVDFEVNLSTLIWIAIDRLDNDE